MLNTFFGPHERRRLRQCRIELRVFAPILFVMVLPVAARNHFAGAQSDDPHRPVCSDSRCIKIRTYLRAHYCGESPYGNGPDDGCKIEIPQGRYQHFRMLADYVCHQNNEHCVGQNEKDSVIQALLVRELERLGMPDEPKGKIYFATWKPKNPNWVLATARYYSKAGVMDFRICQVIAIIEPSSSVTVLRGVPYQKASVDVPRVTQWTPIDFVDVEGNGEIDVILEGDAYENHWFEVIRVANGKAETIFSGLGYWL